MRKVVFSVNVTLDGCVDHEKNEPDRELMDHYTRQADRKFERGALLAGGRGR